jgi:hypothetical protein
MQAVSIAFFLGIAKNIVYLCLICNKKMFTTFFY